MIRPLRVVLVAAACGLAAGVLSLVVEFAIGASTLGTMMAANTEGSGGLGAVSGPLYAPFVAIIGFIAGGVWQLRRRPATRH